jgi:hypothetical protein
MAKVKILENTQVSESQYSKVSDEQYFEVY